MKVIMFFCLLECYVLLVRSEKIIIIGAGASGLSAATRLIENNITDFKIFEAESRLGGRIHSIYLRDGESGAFVDLGGEYVVGEEGNVVYEFAKKALKHSNPSWKIKAFYSDGKPINISFTEEILEFMNNLKRLYEDKKPTSTADVFFERYNSTILKKYESDPEYLQKAIDFTKTCEKMFLKISYNLNKHLLNNHYKDCKGDQDLTWNSQGYRQFLNLLMTKFGEEQKLRLFPITYSTPISKISWKHTSKVLLRTKNDDKHEADHVIFTPSLGVLKGTHEQMFEPNLPQAKVEAIAEAGYDASMKIILQYSESWWDEDVLDFFFVWKHKDDKQADSGLENFSGKSWISSIFNIATVPGVPRVLIVWISGPLVPEIEKLPIQEVQDGVDYVIRKFLGEEYNVTTPSIIIPSTWYSNPNFRGTYSYETVESTYRKRQVQDDLAEPLLNAGGVPVVFFAGEHTSRTHFASVHGAVESGYTAADELIEYLNRK